MRAADLSRFHEVFWCRSDGTEDPTRWVSLRYCRTFQQPRAGEIGLVVVGQREVGGCDVRPRSGTTAGMGQE